MFFYLIFILVPKIINFILLVIQPVSQSRFHSENNYNALSSTSLNPLGPPFSICFRFFCVLLVLILGDDLCELDDFFESSNT